MSKTSLELYAKFLKQLPENPFIAKELFPTKTNQVVGYLTLLDSQNNLLVLLPFIYRKIWCDNKDTGFFDAISIYGFVGPTKNNGIDEKTKIQIWDQVDEWLLNNNVVSEFVWFNFHSNYFGCNGFLVPILQMACMLPLKPTV